MPPSMPNPAKRMTAQPSRPVQRYRPGKAVAEEESSDEEEEEESEEEQQPQKKIQNTYRARPVPQQRTQSKEDGESDEDDDDEGFVTDPEDGDAEGPQQKPVAGTPAVPSKPSASARIESRPIEESDNEDDETDSGDEDEDEDDEDDDSDDDSSSSSPEPVRKFQRPTFIRKSDRSNNTNSSISAISAGLVPDAATSSDHNQTQIKERKIAEADMILREKLERDAAARAAGRRAWDDDDNINEDGDGDGDGEHTAPNHIVDDTDGVDPAAEHAAWRLRELKRLKRDREALIAREREIEELERRRNLTAEEREAEDREFLARQREERDRERGTVAGAGEPRILAKYHHKGAFFRGGDDENNKDIEALAKRNIMGAVFEDEVTDKAALPEYMRVRDMSKLGKKGRTRYKDLKSEDTGRFGDHDRSRRWDGSRKENFGSGSGSGFNRAVGSSGVDERFLPDDSRDAGTGPRISGANASALGDRRRTTTTSQNRSNSPPRRKRRSPEGRQHTPDWDRDKRRRVDAVP